MTQTTDLVLQVKERQQGDFVFVVASQSSPISGGSGLDEIPGRYGVKAARMPIDPYHHWLACQVSENPDSIVSFSGLKKASRLVTRQQSHFCRTVSQHGSTYLQRRAY